MLHIHNGDSTAGTMREAGFPGEHFAFREALAIGPTPSGVSRDEWIEIRAGYLCDDDNPAERVREDLASIDAKIDEVFNQDETILWFEHDLFCQINLAYLLARLSSRAGVVKRNRICRLSLICIGDFPGVADFRGLGQLTSEQLASLFDTRHDVSEAETAVARKAWEGFCSPDPGRLEKLLGEDISPMPFMRAAILQHLARFPSTSNGLGHAEDLLLELIEGGTNRFGALAETFFEAEPAYGLGDGQIWRDLRKMAEALHPLIRSDNVDCWDGSGPVLKASFTITETGRRVLEGEEDFVELNGVDLWLGGVHLTQDNLWRWDGEKQGLTWIQ